MVAKKPSLFTVSDIVLNSRIVDAGQEITGAEVVELIG